MPHPRKRQSSGTLSSQFLFSYKCGYNFVDAGGIAVSGAELRPLDYDIYVVQ